MSHTSHEDMVILKGQKSPTLLTQKLFMANFASLQSFPSEKFPSNDVELHHISQVTCAGATKNMYQHTSNQNVQIFHLGVTYLSYTRQFRSSRFNSEKTLVLPPKINKYFDNRENVHKWTIKSKNIWRSCKIFGLSYTSDTHWSDEFLRLHWGNEVTRIATDT